MMVILRNRKRIKTMKIPETGTEHQWTGPLGSDFWQLCLDPEMVEYMNCRITDWNILGRRILIDTREGIVSWINRSGTNADIMVAVDHIVEAAGEVVGKRIKQMRGTRWRHPDDPPRTGIEADNSFYVGKKAEEKIEAFVSGGRQASEEFCDRTPPDLVVDVEITPNDRDRPARYAGLGIPEAWQVHSDPDQDTKIERPVVEMLDLQAGGRPRRIDRSRVMPGLTTQNMPRFFHPAILIISMEGHAELRKLLAEEMKKPTIH